MIKKTLLKNQKIIEKNIDECFDKSIDITSYLTNLLIRLFNKKFKIITEVKLKNFKGKGGRGGRIDLRIFSSNQIFDVEIDRGNKLNSIEKLIFCKSLGHNVLWIKWGLGINDKAMNKLINNKVDYLYIPTQAHRRK